MPDFTITPARDAVKVQLPGGSADAAAAKAARDEVVAAAAAVAIALPTQLDFSKPRNSGLLPLFG